MEGLEMGRLSPAGSHRPSDASSNDDGRLLRRNSRGKSRAAGRRCYWLFAAALVFLFLIAVTVVLVIYVPREKPPKRPATPERPPAPPVSGTPLKNPFNFTHALVHSLIFFNAQRSGVFRKYNNVSWRGNSCLNDGNLYYHKDLVGGYYDAGDAIKYNFPASFAMTMMSWSVIEYHEKYEAAGELMHVKEIIKWGTDYLLKTFDSDTIKMIVAQIGDRVTQPHNDEYCWMRPEDIDYRRLVYPCVRCSDLAAEMAASFAAASIVFKNTSYSATLLKGAITLFGFSRVHQGRYNTEVHAAGLYNSTGYWDEILWAAAWMYYATGNSSYLEVATNHSIAQKAGVSGGIREYGILTWDNKLAGAHVLLTRFRLRSSPPKPYEERLALYHRRTEKIMCSYLSNFSTYSRTEGGLIQLSQGRPHSLQFVVNAVYLASLFADYLEASHLPEWNCGKNPYPVALLRHFAESQVDYILGKNPRKMSYMVGFGDSYPKQVHHRGASIPNDKIKYTCEGGWKWRDTSKPNPNTIVGAMVAGPDMHDGFDDLRNSPNYTEPSLAGNAGLVAALVSLSGNKA